MKTKNLENFQKLVSNEQSAWLDKFLYYKANKSWLDKSAMVAVNVLEALKAKGWSQKDLAQKMKVSAQQVNKILKGQQNLTFETISKLETALEISLMEIIDYKQVAEIKTSATQIKSASTTLKEEFIVVSVNKDTSTTKIPQMKVVHNKMDYSESHNQYAIAR
ncbi:XRE family transcriptional regulator [Flavobacterium sp. GSN2]|jgi:transcriptional regulator with XRE-family HTH domain|nr:XRE family transcriptional regulator [Flavobacterium sp. GSN2]